MKKKNVSLHSSTIDLFGMKLDLQLFILTATVIERNESRDLF